MQYLMLLLPGILSIGVIFGWYWGCLGRASLITIMRRLWAYWFLFIPIIFIDLIAAGRLGQEMGLSLAFRDEATQSFTLRSKTIWSSAMTTYLTGVVWLIIYLLLYIDLTYYQMLPKDDRSSGWNPREVWATPCQNIGKFKDYHGALEFLGATVPPFLPLPIFMRDYLDAGSMHEELKWVFGCFLGVLIGVTELYILVRVAWKIMDRVSRLRSRLGIPRFKEQLSFGKAELPTQEAAHCVAWVVVAINLMIFSYCLAAKQMPISLAIGTLLGYLVIGYLIIKSIPVIIRISLIFCLAYFALLGASNPYSYRFPGIDRISGESYYAARNLVKLQAEARDPALPLLSSPDVLDAWKARLGDARPKLVLLAVSGGGYRASFWTATVLDSLEEHSRAGGNLEGLADRIRLITGASGGMVGASYYVSIRAKGGTYTSVVDALLSDTRLDSLSLIIQQLVQGDIPNSLFPIAYQSMDRGIAFEEQWRLLLNLTFSDLRQLEANGAVPSLILSPWIIDTGEPLLISNLDLAELLRPHTRSGTSYGSTGREFFRLFPGAQDTFKLRTAVRMSASFPYILPAVSLPTIPPARIVDAGYFDNYGISLAAAWIQSNRTWIRHNTSGVAIIQINAYGADPALSMPSGNSPVQANATLPGLGRHALEWLTSPLEGAATARVSGMLVRGEEQLRLLDEVLNGTGFNFKHFLFEYYGSGAMNVIFNSRDLQVMRNSIVQDASKAGDNNARTMKALVDWWRDRRVDP